MRVSPRLGVSGIASVIVGLVVAVAVVAFLWPTSCVTTLEGCPSDRPACSSGGCTNDLLDIGVGSWAPGVEEAGAKEDMRERAQRVGLASGAAAIIASFLAVNAVLARSQRSVDAHITAGDGSDD